MQRIEAVVFDWGGVLIDNPASPLMAYCAKALGVSVQEYTQVHDRHSEAFQKGWIVEEVFWQRVCGDLGRSLPQAALLWGEAFGAVYSPRAEVFATAEQLHRKGYKTALLSNTEAPAMTFFLELGYPMFDAAIFSCAEGTFKPEKEIYEIAARELVTPPDRCVLIDDRPIFIEGARNAGMRGIVFRSLEQAKQDLAALGVSAE